jgi:hypothetical protein
MNEHGANMVWFFAGILFIVLKVFLIALQDGFIELSLV